MPADTVGCRILAIVSTGTTQQKYHTASAVRSKLRNMSQLLIRAYRNAPGVSLMTHSPETETQHLNSLALTAHQSP